MSLDGEAETEPSHEHQSPKLKAKAAAKSKDNDNMVSQHHIQNRIGEVGALAGTDDVITVKSSEHVDITFQASERLGFKLELPGPVVVYRPDAEFHKQKRLVRPLPPAILFCEPLYEIALGPISHSCGHELQVRPIARVKSVAKSAKLAQETPTHDVEQGMLLLAVNGTYEVTIQQAVSMIQQCREERNLVTLTMVHHEAIAAEHMKTNSVGRLHVCVVGAENMPHMDLIGCADPYCVVEFGRGCKKRIRQTEVRTRDVDPIWNELIK